MGVKSSLLAEHEEMLAQPLGGQAASLIPSETEKKNPEFSDYGIHAHPNTNVMFD